MTTATTTTTERYWPLKRAARYAGVSITSLRRLLRDGSLTAYRPVKSKIVVDSQELETLIRATSREA